MINYIITKYNPFTANKEEPKPTYGLLNDKEITELCYADYNNSMIKPFIPTQVKRSAQCDGRGYPLYSTVSHGLSSFGYDIRLSSEEFYTFKHLPGKVVDPKDFDCAFLEQQRCIISGDDCGEYFIVPGNSYALGVTVEKFNMPKDVMAICMTKSTYARCFTGDTKVKLVDGDFTFLELIEKANRGERLYGYGVKDGQIIAQELIAPRFIESSKTLKVTLDNDAVIECTPDHKFLTRKGEYKQACDLTPGESLHPIYDSHSHGYPSIWDSVYADTQECRANGFRTVHRMVAQDIMGESLDGVHVHHKDGNVANNHPDNLELVNPKEHTKLHNEQDLRHIKGGEAFKQKFESNSQFREHICSKLHSEESKNKSAQARKEFYNSPESASYRELKRKQSVAMWQNAPEERRSKQAQFAATLNKRYDITAEALTSALLSEGTIRGAARKLNVDRSAFRRFPQIMEQFKQGTLGHNHKVKSIEYLDEVKPTYCLTAPSTGNFALSAGVFVSNCGIFVNVTPLEPGWKGYLTLEIANCSNSDVRVYANEGIAQLLFFRSDRPSITYDERTGKYNDQENKVVTAKV